MRSICPLEMTCLRLSGENQWQWWRGETVPETRSRSSPKGTKGWGSYVWVQSNSGSGQIFGEGSDPFFHI